MTKIDIFSGFLGAGKTTLIRKLIAEAYKGEKLVLIENEFGEIAIDGGFLQDAGVEITEMNSGCICCTLVGDFTKALRKVMDDFAPDRILIEPSGVGKLSDVARAVERVEGAVIGSRVTVVDASKARMYARNFGEFFNDQVENADLIVLSRTDATAETKVVAAAELLKSLNPNAKLISTPWDRLDGAQIRETMEHDALHEEMERLRHEHEHHHHHDDEDEHEHHHHHHHDGEECDDPECECHHHHDEDEDEHGHHHHHHHADEIFTSWGHETARKFTESGIREILAQLDDEAKYGVVLRAKGIVDASDGEWIYFDYVPGEIDVRRGRAAVTGRFCVIGSKMNEEALKELFGLE
ncbi:MAG: GTP-binding protein [Oscillospiraceae bacterium]|nr:GTP-binding protein [Oscillospiraceae bacterium]